MADSISVAKTEPRIRQTGYGLGRAGVIGGCPTTKPRRWFLKTFRSLNELEIIPPILLASQSDS